MIKSRTMNKRVQSPALCSSKMGTIKSSQMFTCSLMLLFVSCQLTQIDATNHHHSNNNNNNNNNRDSFPRAPLNQDDATALYRSNNQQAETAETTQLNKKQTVALHHAVKKLLGFKDGPSMDKLKLSVGLGGGGGTGGGGAGGNPGVGGGGEVNEKSNSLVVEPPQYMLDLYERYKHGVISHRHMTGNTVRCISGHIGSVGNDKAFIFNLSSVARTERVFNAEIHIFRKRMRSYRNSSISLRLHRISLGKTYDSGAVDLDWSGNNKRGAWLSVDTTPAVKSSIAQRRDPGDVLGVTFRKLKKNSRKSRSMSLHRFMDHMAMPFLVLYSNDTQNITLDHVDPHFRSADLEEEIVDPEFGYDPTFTDFRHHDKPFFDYDDYDSFSSEDDDEEEKKHLSKSEKRKNRDIFSRTLDRRRRSIFDNEIPEEPVETGKQGAPFNVPLTNPIVVDEHQIHAHNKSHHGNEEHPEEGEEENGKNHHKSDHKTDKDLEQSDRKQHQIQQNFNNRDENGYDLIPYPDDFKKERKNRRRNRRKNRKHRRRRPHHDRQLPLPPEWEAELKKERVMPSSRRDKLCGRRKLVVDFADIGWSDWIISPKSFEAHYCAGQCPFPLTKGLRPSNHATIQSLVHAIGIPADVPAPCCVPDVMSSVTLLYFDENRNVVLKNYPSMSVQSCACR